MRFDLVKKAASTLRDLNKYPEIQIKTNGTILNKEILAFIKKFNIAIDLTLDGPPENHNIHRRFYDGSGSYNVIADNVMLLKKGGINVTINYVVTPDTVKNSAKNLLYLVKNFGVSTFFGYAYVQEMLSREDIDSFVREIISFSHCYLKERLYLIKTSIDPFDLIFLELLFSSRDESLRQRLLNPQCNFKKPCFFPNGDIHLCPASQLLQSKYRDKMIIGNLHKSKNIIDNEKLMFFNKNFTLYSWLKNPYLRRTNKLCYLRCHSGRSVLNRFILDVKVREAILLTFSAFLQKMPFAEIQFLRTFYKKRKNFIRNAKNPVRERSFLAGQKNDKEFL